MKKWRSMLAAVLALGMLASVTSCGASDEEKSPDKSSDNAPVSEAEPEIGVPDPDETGDVEEKTEAPTENNELYKHYDLLAAEYEKTGNTSAINIKPFYAYQDGTVIFTVNKDDEYYLCTYDINTKKLTENADSFHRDSDIYYCNGYVYVWDHYGYDGLKKYELKCNEIGSIKSVVLDGYNGPVITEEGYSWATNGNEHFIVSPDLSTATPVPPLKIKDSHGLEQEISTSYVDAFAAYGNKIFVEAITPSDEYGIFYYDIDSNTWNSSKFTFEEHINTNRCTTVGKYCLYSFDNKYTVGIYDMEADEIITESTSYISDSSNLCKGYFGGTYNIVNNHDDNTLYRVQYPEGDNRLDLEELNPVALGTETNYYICPLNDTYYIIQDDAGIFLRTYEKGEMEEEIVYVFNN